MDRKSKQEQLKPAELTSDKIRTGIIKLERRIKELEEFDISTIQERFDAKTKALETKINDTIADIFGYETIGYRNYNTRTLDRLPLRVRDGRYPIYQVRERYKKGIKETIVKLKSLKETLEEKLEDIDGNIKEKISIITRQAIFDELSLSRISWSGRLDEPDFLSRLYDLKKMPSRDYRFNNAYDDIYQHMVINNDWETDWVFTDMRFNLMHASDDEYLRFLAETLHPAVRMDEEEILKIQEIYNNHLEADGFEIIQTSEISRKPVFEGRQKVIGKSHLIAKKAEIKKYLNTEYVNNKINLMNEAVTSDTDLAIGTAKELIETACKSISKKHGKVSSPDWNLGRLLKETSDILDFKPKKATNPDKAETSIKQILKGITTLINGVAELRNAYGTGHGKDSDFQMLESKYAKLIVGTVSELVIFYLATDGENIELVE